ncbi:hypothetical protein BY458DRAFT_505152 [Sporodiniella umbellata]|nr:hypothetical protein BY458DRAFT_505152 [Sporodiniella umbellata]
MLSFSNPKSVKRSMSVLMVSVSLVLVFRYYRAADLEQRMLCKLVLLSCILKRKIHCLLCKKRTIKNTPKNC